MTGKEKRDEIIILRVSPADKERIRLKMDELGVQNMSAFIRKMALDGYCVNLDLTDIYEEDIQDLQERFETFWQIGKNLLARLSTIQ